MNSRRHLACDIAGGYGEDLGTGVIHDRLCPITVALSEVREKRGVAEPNREVWAEDPGSKEKAAY